MGVYVFQDGRFVIEQENPRSLTLPRASYNLPSLLVEAYLPEDTPQPQSFEVSIYLDPADPHIGISFEINDSPRIDVRAIRPIQEPVVARREVRRARVVPVTTGGSKGAIPQTIGGP